MKEQLQKLALTEIENPFDQETEFDLWNQFDIQEMRNLLCKCTVKPRRSKEELDNMIKKIREAN
jgi:hypothetical protein